MRPSTRLFIGGPRSLSLESISLIVANLTQELLTSIMPGDAPGVSSHRVFFSFLRVMSVITNPRDVAGIRLS